MSDVKSKKIQIKLRARVNRFRKPTLCVLDKKTFLEALNKSESNSKNNLKILHAACKYDRDDVVCKLLEELKVDTDGADEDGQTAIFYAIQSNSLDCFNLLVNNGANVCGKDKDGKSTLIACIDSNNFTIAGKLLTKSNLTKEIINEAIQYVIISKNSEALAILSDFQPVQLDEFAGYLNFVDKRQYSALHYAAKRGFSTAVLKLIYAGSKPNNWSLKESPALLAWKYNQLESYSLLLKAGYFLFSEMKLPGFTQKWLLIIKHNGAETFEKESGLNIQNLLKCLKTYHCLEEHSNAVDLQVICQNIQYQIELLDFFPVQQLSSLVLHNCSLKYIPVLPNITHASFNNCNIDNFTNLTSYCKLKFLTLQKCGLIELPESLANLKYLVFLNASYNIELTQLPLWLNKIPLRILSLRHNSIRELPQLLPPSLEILDVCNNCIQKLSPLISTLLNLKSINVQRNPLIFPELSITRGSTKAILQYLHAFLEGTIPNTTIKLSIVGKEHVGKSTLVEALKSSSGICENELIEKTNGLEITDLNLNNMRLRVFDLAGDIDFIESHSMFISESTLYLALFDLRSYNFSNSSKFLTRILMWLSSIYAQAPNSRVILVGTNADRDMITPSYLNRIWLQIQSMLFRASIFHKQEFSNNMLHNCLLCNSLPTFERRHIGGVAGFVTKVLSKPDLDTSYFLDKSTCNAFAKDSNVYVPTENSNESNASTEPDLRDGQLKFPHILSYCEVSGTRQLPKMLTTSNNLSVQQLKDIIQTGCVDLLNLAPSIPQKWGNLLNVLISQAEKHFPIISFDHFLELAAQCSFKPSDDDVKPFLLHYHSCGNLLYYGDNDELSDFIITDPQWLSNQLRTVITYHEIPLLVEGILHHTDLEIIWSHIEVKFHEKLILLFRQAGVFIQFEKDSELIPCRLPIGRPSEDIWPRYPKSNEKQIDYYLLFDYLPPSFFTHLMVLVQSKYHDSSLKMAPVYFNNHIVYITKSQGIPCDIHTKQRNSVNLLSSESENSDMILNGLNLAKFLLLDPNSVDSLMDSSRNSFQVTTNDDYAENVVGIDMAESISCRHRIHIELHPHKSSITISIRGSQPCCLAPETIDLVNRIRLTKYRGTNISYYILCPVCVLKLHENPEKFSLSNTLTFEPVCEKGHDLNCWDNILTGKCDYRPDISAQSIITNLHESECPKLFIMVPLNIHSVGLAEFYTLSYLKEGYAIHLLCEYPGCWHLLNSPGYRLTRPKDFVKKYGQRLQTILKVLSSLETPLKLASTMFEPLGYVADSCESLNQFATDLEGYLSDFQDEWNFVPNASMVENLKYLKSSQGLQRREFRRFLNKADEEERFGDLIPTFYGDRVLWTCEKHHKILSIR